MYHGMKRGRGGFRGGYSRGGGLGGRFGARPRHAVHREKTCPLLLRVFPHPEGHRGLEDFSKMGEELKPELRIYTWMDATLKELFGLIREAYAEARGESVRLSFALIYPDATGRLVMKQIGTVEGERRGRDDGETLQQLGFQIGDFLSVAVYT